MKNILTKLMFPCVLAVIPAYSMQSVVKTPHSSNNGYNTKYSGPLLPLHEAMKARSFEDFKKLVESKVPLGAHAAFNEEIAFNVTPLHYAAQEGLTEYAALLLQHGADKNAITALAWDYDEEGRFLWDFDEGPGGLLPFQYALRAGHVECMKLLLPARTNAMKASLKFALSNGDFICAQVLSEYLEKKE